MNIAEQIIFWYNCLMNMYLIGHAYRYATEQMLMTLFPGEKPEYSADRPPAAADSIERRLVTLLSDGQYMVTANCLYCDGTKCFYGRSAVRREALYALDEVHRDSLLSQLLKTAVYRAVLRSGRAKPVWGALTGVRPGKLMTALLQDGLTDTQAVRRFERTYDVSHERALLCLETAQQTLACEKELEEKDICLYIGIPFCPTRCAYCSFVSQSVEKSMGMIPPFLDALYREMNAVAHQVDLLGLRVVSVYMGGGTPTTLSAVQLEELFQHLQGDFDLAGLREITGEAGRPDTITEEKIRVLSGHGVTRVSVNPQSMNDSVLDAIGRRHSAEDIRQALRIVREGGSFSVNMDLIAGLPSDTCESFCRSLDEVMALEPENITVHTLSIKRGAKLHFGEKALPGPKEVAGMLDYANAHLSAADYQPYYLYRQKNMSGGFENIGWSRPGYENLYNICIMEELRSILAMGAGGSTKLIRLDGGRNSRMVAPKYPTEYMEAIDRLCREKEKISDFYHQT